MLPFLSVQICGIHIVVQPSLPPSTPLFHLPIETLLTGTLYPLNINFPFPSPPLTGPPPFLLCLYDFD